MVVVAVELVLIGIGLIVLIIALMFLPKTFYTVKQWEKVALLRFGKIKKIVEPGLHLKIPYVDSVLRVDLRMSSVDMRGQSAITKDNISVGVDAVVFMKVEDAEKIILKVKNFQNAISKYAQTSIRNIIGRYSLDELLESREEIASELKKVIDNLATDWGIDIAKAELQDISLPVDMKRAFAVQAEAEREARAILIKADAELKASVTLKKAAVNMKDPNAMQLRVLSTINDVSKDQSNTIILALPLETLRATGLQGIASLSAIKPSMNEAKKQI